MNKLILLLCLIIPAEIFASKYVLDSSDIASMNVFSIYELIKQFPEIEPLYIDASDIAVQTGNRTSLNSDALLFAYNETPYASIPAGAQMHSMKPFLFAETDTIELLTGSDARKIAPGADLVINVKGSSKIRPKFHFTGTGDVGSEVGDPALYKQILPAEKIPYNKDQIIDGEAVLSYGGKRVMQSVGLGVTLVDYYSNKDEQARTADFGKRNSSQSLNEHYDPYVRTAAELGKISIDAVGTHSRYAVQRWSPIQSKYCYHEGGITTVQPRIKLHLNDRSSLTAALSASKSAGFEYRTNTDSVSADQMLLFGALSFESKQTAHGTITARISADSSETLQIVGSAGYESDRGWRAGFVNRGVWFSGSLPERAVFPQISVDLTLQNLDDRNRLCSEIQHTFRSDVIRGYHKIVLSTEPDYRIAVQNGKLNHLYDRTRYRTDPTYLFRIKHPRAGEFSGLAGPFQSRASVKKEFAIENLVLSPELRVSAPVWWNGFQNSEPVRFWERTDSCVRLDPHVSMDIAARCAFLKNRITLAAALKNIGKKHTDIPNGNSLGMLVVTSMTLKL